LYRYVVVMVVSERATLFEISARAMSAAFAAAPEYEVDAIRARRMAKAA
jgi:hypothetical protein